MIRASLLLVKANMIPSIIEFWQKGKKNVMCHFASATFEID